MESKNKNKKIAIYLAILIVLLGGSFIIYKIARANIDNAVISNITMTSIETGTNFDSDDGLVITCDNEGKNCTNSYIASKDSSKDNILVKSFDKIKYNFTFDVKDSSDETNDVEDVKVNLRITLNGDDKKYVTFDENNCDNTGLCVIRDNSSFESTNYSVTLNVYNAPNGYEIHPTFTFDVEENNYDEPVVLGYNESSETNYYYSYDGTYASVGPANYMPTIVSSAPVYETYSLVGENTFTQSANYDEKDGRFITYLLGIKLNTGIIPGSYYPKDEITIKATFDQDGLGDAISNENWIRLYGAEVTDGIRSVQGALPYSTSSIGEPSKYIKNPGNAVVTKEGNTYIIKISGFELLNNPSLNADNSGVDGFYIATVALTNFSPRLDGDGQNAINNTITLYDENNTPIGTKTIQNTYEQVSGSIESDDPNIDVLTSSAFYDENETTRLTTNGRGSVSKGTIVKYITKFKTNKTSGKATLKEVSKFDTYAYRVLPYNETDDVSIKIKCGKTECSNISKDDFEVKFVSGTFDDSSLYELNDVSTTKLSDNDKTLAGVCSGYNLAYLNRDQIQNLYGGPCIKAVDGAEETFNKIDDAASITDGVETEIPISKVIVQTKEGVTLPDGAEVVVTIKARVRNVPDVTQTYQATTMISTSDYDSKLYYYAPQIKNITDADNNAISADNYIKNAYSEQYIGDTLSIVSFSLKQNISVTNKNSDGSMKTKYRTVNNETITYKVETSLVDNGMNIGADDTWYIKLVKANVILPKGLIYIPDDDLIKPVTVEINDNYTRLEYIIITSGDKIKANMKINDIYFKAKLSPTLSGKAVELTVESYPYGENINGEYDRTVGGNAKFSIYGTGINEVIGTESVGASGSLIEKNGTIDYVLNAYNNVGEPINDYTLINILPYTGDENGSNFTGSYSVKVTSETVGLENLLCTKEVPSKITADNENIWESCGNIGNEFIDGITGIKITNISIQDASYMGEIVVSLKTKDNKASDKYNNRFYGYTATSSENSSNIIETSVINRTISGVVFLDNTGDSVRDGNETYINNVPVTLYKVTNDGVLKNVAETVTDENGKYEFANLDKGRYKIRAKYDVNKYDLALRYATEDVNKDSDAYLIDTDGTVEISDKSETSKGLVLYPPVNSISNMDIGLQPKHTFGFIMDKYITRIDLTNNGAITTNNYNNLSTVSISVLNPNRYTAKVYYGISITNNSNKAGYVNLVKEDIPNGFIFDKNYPENAGWFEVDGMIGNRTLENTLINPGETVYLQIVLFLPARDEAGAFINTASIAEITEYIPVIKNVADKEYVNEDQYAVGDSLRYAGVNFHVIGVAPDGNEQILTLLADANQTAMAHNNGVYKWSTSAINGYLNNNWLESTRIDSSKLIGFNICDDASGLFNPSANGGVVDAPNCAGNIYTTSKVRLLTAAEFNNLVNNLTDSSFLLNGDFWLMDAVYATANDTTYNEYGVLNNSYDTSSLAKYVMTSNSSVLPVQGTNGFSKDITVETSLQVRPVIRISTHNIILE